MVSKPKSNFDGNFLTEDQREFREYVRKWCSKMIKNLGEEIRLSEAQSEHPENLHKEISKEKWPGIISPIEYGGLGKGAMEYAIINEEFCKAGIPCFGVHGCIGFQLMLLDWGTEEQKDHYLPKVANGEYKIAGVISEPKAGSSFKLLSTTAKRKGDFYVINGIKTHINLAREAEVMWVFVKTQNGFSILIVEKGSPGLEFIKLESIALRSAPLYEVIFRECTVPAHQIIGNEGEGMNLFISGFNLTRIGNASQCIGWARCALERAVNYARNRPIGNLHVTDFQGIQWMIVDMVASLEAAKLYRDKTAWMHDNGFDHSKETGIAKLLAAQISEDIISKSMRIMGGYSCYRDQPFVDLYNHVKVIQLGGGSLEVMKNIVARQILKSYQF